MIEAIEILMLLGVLTALGLPILLSGRKSGEELVEGDELHRLLYKKDVTYMSLKDLEFEYQTGKIDESDYNSLKTKYEAEAVSILKEIDNAEKSGKSSKKESGKRFCSECGTSVSRSDKFCSSCGNRL